MHEKRDCINGTLITDCLAHSTPGNFCFETPFEASQAIFWSLSGQKNLSGPKCCLQVQHYAGFSLRQRQNSAKILLQGPPTCIPPLVHTMIGLLKSYCWFANQVKMKFETLKAIEDPKQRISVLLC